MGNRQRLALGLLTVAAFTGAIAAPSAAQSPSPNQPEAIPGLRGPTVLPCPRLGPSGTIQPLRIQPRQVAAKNRMGCLSAEDALYGPDGCPVRFCGTATPRLALPGPAPQAPAP
ncbi:MAG: hypothetical protein VKK97_08145 [Synechococcaceae cyanobacterium]|nr:hypothetical protein [Synechococcaceae cyanobacterium]